MQQGILFEHFLCDRIHIAERFATHPRHFSSQVAPRALCILYLAKGFVSLDVYKDLSRFLAMVAQKGYMITTKSRRIISAHLYLKSVDLSSSSSLHLNIRETWSFWPAMLEYHIAKGGSRGALYLVGIYH